MRYRRAAGDVLPRYRPQKERRRSFLTLSHTLAINDCLIALELLTRSRTDLSLTAQLDERALKRRRLRVTWYDAGTAVSAAVVPDAWCQLEWSGPRDRFRQCLHFEIDRGSEHQAAWRRRIRTWLAYADGPYQAAFGTTSLTIAIVATPGEQRMRQLLTWTMAELASLGRAAHRPSRNLFWFTAEPAANTPPESFFCAPCWRVPGVAEKYALLGGEEPA